MVAMLFISSVRQLQLAQQTQLTQLAQQTQLTQLSLLNTQG